jgi:hypothetical protein
VFFYAGTGTSATNIFLVYRDIGHKSDFCRRKNLLATPPHEFFLLENFILAFDSRTQAKLFACLPAQIENTSRRKYFLFVRVPRISPSTKNFPSKIFVWAPARSQASLLGSRSAVRFPNPSSPRAWVYPHTYKKRRRSISFYMCAGTGNRTRIYTLEVCHSTIKLYPQIIKNSLSVILANAGVESGGYQIPRSQAVEPRRGHTNFYQEIMCDTSLELQTGFPSSRE